jgi:hypothetical protein
MLAFGGGGKFGAGLFSGKGIRTWNAIFVVGGVSKKFFVGDDMRVCSVPDRANFVVRIARSIFFIWFQR